MHLGGMLDDRKSDIYTMIPDHYLPKTIVFQAQNSDISELIKANNLTFPLIVKPDIGYKGFMVKRVDDEKELHRVLGQFEEKEVLVQEFLNHEREFAFLFYRMPKSQKYGVSSFVEKILPYVMGDGKSNLKALIEENANAFLDLGYVLNKKKEDLDTIIPKGQKIIVDHVGNYSRGSKFYSRNDSIDESLIETGRQFFNHLQGINFGRIDLKANSIADVKNGKFKVMEINGVKSEPLHIYEPEMSWIKIWEVISEHWKILNSIAKEQLSGSYSLPSAKDGIEAAKSLKRQTTN